MISRYVLVDRDDNELDHEYNELDHEYNELDHEQAKTEAAKLGYAIIEREYIYDDQSLVWTPDGSDHWPPDTSDVLPHYYM